MTPATKQRYLASGACAVAIALVLGACSSSDDATLTTPSTPAAGRRARDDGPRMPRRSPSCSATRTRSSRRARSRTPWRQGGFTADVRGISGSGVKDNATDWFPAAGAIGTGAAAGRGRRAGDERRRLPRRRAGVPGPCRGAPRGARTTLSVVWVTHTEAGGGRDPAARASGERRDPRPAGHAPERDSVLDLAPVLAARPNLLGPDKLHYSGHGREVFAERIATAARDRRGRACVS